MQENINEEYFSLIFTYHHDASFFLNSNIHQSLNQTKDDVEDEIVTLRRTGHY